MSYRTKLVGCCSFAPAKVVTNNDLSQVVDTSDEWIRQRTGIIQRRIADENETSLTMAVEAVRALLDKFNINPEDIDLIISSTTTSTMSFPSLSALVQKEIGNRTAMSFSLQEACSGFVYGVTIADKFIRSGSHKMALVIGSEKMSSIVDWSDRNTCVLFGDGAGAALFTATEDINTGVLDSICFSDGSMSVALNTDTPNKKVTMMGQEVFKHAVTHMTNLVKEILQRNSLNIDDIAMIIPHQANQRILSSVARNLHISEDKVASNVAMFANTSSATIPMALDKVMQDGKLKGGDLIILESVGAGLTWGAVLIRV